MNARTGGAFDQELAAVLRPIPESSLQIQHLYVSDETFREFAVILQPQNERSKPSRVCADPIRSERRAEFAEMANYLASEIEGAISRQSAVSFRR